MQSRRISSAGPAWRAHLARLLLLALLVAPLGACSSFGSLFGKEEVVPDQPPEKLYNEGIFLLDKRQDFKAAATKFEEVERQHPYSEWARKSLIMSAYAYYEARQYDDCIATAKRYISLHPGSAEAPYALPGCRLM